MKSCFQNEFEKNEFGLQNLRDGDRETKDK